MIFAAGLGTRLKPLTDTMPKAMVPVAGSPLLEHVLLRLKACGFLRVVVNVHHFSQQIIDFLRANDNFGLDLSISDETAQLLDTGGGLRKAFPLFNANSPVLLHNVDILSNVDLTSFYDHSQEADATLLVSERKTQRYLLFDEDYRLRGWTNIATGEIRSPYPLLNIGAHHRYAFSGIHVVSPRLLPLMENFPEKFGIMDFYLQACDKADIRAHVSQDLRLMDVGKLDTLSEADRFAESLGDTYYI